MRSAERCDTGHAGIFDTHGFTKQRDFLMGAITFRTQADAAVAEGASRRAAGKALRTTACVPFAEDAMYSHLRKGADRTQPILKNLY